VAYLPRAVLRLDLPRLIPMGSWSRHPPKSRRLSALSPYQLWRIVRKCKQWRYLWLQPPWWPDGKDRLHEQPGTWPFGISLLSSG